MFFRNLIKTRTYFKNDAIQDEKVTRCLRFFATTKAYPTLKWLVICASTSFRTELYKVIYKLQVYVEAMGHAYFTKNGITRAALDTLLDTLRLYYDSLDNM